MTCSNLYSTGATRGRKRQRATCLYPKGDWRQRRFEPKWSLLDDPARHLRQKPVLRLRTTGLLRHQPEHLHCDFLLNLLQKKSHIHSTRNKSGHSDTRTQTGRMKWSQKNWPTSHWAIVDTPLRSSDVQLSSSETVLDISTSSPEALGSDWNKTPQDFRTDASASSDVLKDDTEKVTVTSKTALMGAGVPWRPRFNDGGWAVTSKTFAVLQS